jgi:hypothetical protein
MLWVKKCNFVHSKFTVALHFYRNACGLVINRRRLFAFISVILRHCPKHEGFELKPISPFNCTTDDVSGKDYNDGSLIQRLIKTSLLVFKTKTAQFSLNQKPGISVQENL